MIAHLGLTSYKKATRSTSQSLFQTPTMTTTLLADQFETTAARSALTDVDLASMIALVGNLAAATVESASLAALLQSQYSVHLLQLH
jgi:hypothetical protein